MESPFGRVQPRRFHGSGCHDNASRGRFLQNNILRSVWQDCCLSPYRKHGVSVLLKAPAALVYADPSAWKWYFVHITQSSYLTNCHVFSHEWLLGLHHCWPPLLTTIVSLLLTKIEDNAGLPTEFSAPNKLATSCTMVNNDKGPTATSHT